MLINIHGQHDNQVLLDSEKHLHILDEFGGDNSLLEAYRETFRELQQTARKLGDLKRQEQYRIERSRYLNEIIDDLGELELTENEDELLEQEYETAKNRYKELGFRVVTYLDGQNDKNIHDGLKAVIKNHYGKISS